MLFFMLVSFLIYNLREKVVFVSPVRQKPFSSKQNQNQNLGLCLELLELVSVQAGTAFTHGSLDHGEHEFDLTPRMVN